MKINFPTFNEYQAVLQSPAYCFNLNELRLSRIETDMWGLPRVRSGGFALTYKLSNQNRSLAVRCFHRHVADRTFRYTAITNFITQTPSDIIIPVRYLTNGIRVRETWFPITFMPWIEGDTLETYLVKTIHQPDAVQALVPELLHVVAELERLGISHGDLSHRNILIKSQKMVLVDYDGMFVPGLEGRKSCEVGNIHFQLPDRKVEHFNAGIDHFSEIVIYLALMALSRDPSLWTRYETGGEGLLFKREDFLDPYQSKLLHDIEALPELAGSIGLFRRICTSPVEMAPRLADFIEQKPLDAPRSEAGISTTAQPPMMDSTQRYSLINKVGKVVSVVGKVSEVFHGSNKNGDPHIFVNMGNWKTKCFTIVLWNESLKLFEASALNPDQYLNTWVCVTGMMTAYERRPQIAIDSPTDILALHGEQEAQDLINRGHLIKEDKDYPTLPGLLSGMEKEIPPYDLPIKTNRPAVLPTHNLDQTETVIDRLESLYSQPKNKKQN